MGQKTAPQVPKRRFWPHGLSARAGRGAQRQERALPRAGALPQAQARAGGADAEPGGFPGALTVVTDVFSVFCVVL